MMHAKLYGSILSLRSFLSFGLLGFVTNTSAANSVMDILKPYYPLYNEALQCHGAIAPSGSVNGLNNEPYMTGYCIDIDRQKVIETNKGKRLYILITGDESFDENGEEVLRGHAHSGLVGMFVLKPNDNDKGWQVESANPYMNVGSFGRELSNWQLQSFSPNIRGSLNVHNNALQGYHSDQLVILIANGADITESWIGVNYNNEDAGKCEDDISECDNVKTTFSIDMSKRINGFYPLKLTVNGVVNGTVYNNVNYYIKYKKDKGYIEPNDYPLKDNY
ncbi:hypothetical protein [Psychrobacter sp. DAB_AL62B]|uniref:hypothetical protein n=1 Tax=Psychrobacter sp. DAB_AL62B TaxID=1028420 RepID=UPI002380E859|nr:hypothetical protein [Psychrobacter sp. DAB_AL62B]MDE4455460.1 hypothetical protein [Psychrobacter sp. DAB_AL62B]